MPFVAKEVSAKHGLLRRQRRRAPVYIALAVLCIPTSLVFPMVGSMISELAGLDRTGSAAGATLGFLVLLAGIGLLAGATTAERRWVTLVALPLALVISVMAGFMLLAMMLWIVVRE